MGKRERRLASYNEGRRADSSSDEADDPEYSVEAAGDSGNESDFHPTQDIEGSDGISSEDSDDEELEAEVGLRLTCTTVPSEIPEPGKEFCNVWVTGAP